VSGKDSMALLADQRKDSENDERSQRNEQIEREGHWVFLLSASSLDVAGLRE